MIERVVEYLVNAVWQLPLLALGAWWLLRLVRLGPRVQHGLWVAVLCLGVGLPLARVSPVKVAASTEIGARPTGKDLLPGQVGLDRIGSIVAASHEAVRAPAPLLTGGRLLRRRSLGISVKAARVVGMLYLATLLVGLVRILLAWGASRRVVRESVEIELGDAAQGLMEECRRKLGVKRPLVAESGAVSSPAIVGVMAPVLLLPAGFGGCAEDEMRAMLLHEMAHIRRRDYGANLLCELMALPVGWHPVTHAVQGRIRSTREMVCDAMAAGEMESAIAYARSLVTLASGQVGGMKAERAMTAGLFTNNNLEERVMQLTDSKQAMGTRARVVRAVSGVVGVAAVMGLAMVVHVTPVLAQAPAEAPTTQNAPSTAGTQTGASSEAPQSAPAVSDAPAAEVKSDRNTPTTAAPDTLVGADGEGQVSAWDQKAEKEPLAMAHGEHATVTPKEGEYVHTWTAADGKKFEVLTRQAAEPSFEEKKRFEEEFKNRTADLELLQEDELKLDSIRELRDLDEVKLQADVARLKSPEFQRDLKLKMDKLNVHLKDLKINDVELQKQLAKLNSEDLRKQLAEAQKQIAEAGVQRAEAQKRLDEFGSEQMKQQMAELNRQVAMLARQQIQSQVKDEVQKQVEEQLKEAQKHLDEARRQMEKAHAQAAEHP